MSVVEKGDVVLVRYTGRLDSGEIFDSNEEGGDPLQFEVGAGHVIPGFENAVLGLAKGDARTVRIPPEEAYGVRDTRLVTKLDRALFGDEEPEIGMHLDLQDAQGNMHHADVVGVDETGVTVDLNHHLAGEALTFDIRVESIEKA